MMTSLWTILLKQEKQKVKQIYGYDSKWSKRSSLTKSEEAIKDNGCLAKLNFRAKGKWINGAHNQVTINDFYCACQAHCRSPPFFYEKDEPMVLLGVRRRIMAPTPLNMLLRL